MKIFYILIVAFATPVILLTSTGAQDPYPYEIITEKKIEFMFFNVTNPQDVVLRKAQPMLAEVGPYVYKVETAIENVSEAPESFYYYQRNSYFFSPEESCPGCKKNDSVMILSPVWAMINYVWPLIPRDLNIPLPSPYSIYGNITYDFIANLVTTFNSYEDGVFLNAQIDHVLYQGVSTGITDFSWQLLQTLAPDFIPKINDMYPRFADGKFGFYKGKNDTIKDSFYRANNQIESYQYRDIIEFNGKTSLNDFWWPDVSRTPSMTEMGGKGICHDIKGTDGTIFSSEFGKESRDELWIFDLDQCRSLPHTFTEKVPFHDIYYHDIIEARRFKPAKLVYNASDPDNFCYCPKFLQCASQSDDAYDNQPCQTEKFACVDGLVHVGKCLMGETNTKLPAPLNNIDLDYPISMSLPHFLRGDPRLLMPFTGLSPDPDKHESHLDLDPDTGVAVSSHKRLQLNMPLRKIEDFTPFYNLTQDFMAFPIFWYDEVTTIFQPSRTTTRPPTISTTTQPRTTPTYPWTTSRGPRPSTPIPAPIHSQCYEHYTLGDCTLQHNEFTTESAEDAAHCQQICTEVYPDQCDYFVYDGTCKLMSKPSFTAYFEACLAHNGPSDDMNAAYCSQMDLFVEEHSCEVFRKTDCTGGNSFKTLSMIINEHKCQEACHEEEFCKSYTYYANEEVCELLNASDDHICASFAGPSKPPLTMCF